MVDPADPNIRSTLIENAYRVYPYSDAFYGFTAQRRHDLVLEDYQPFQIYESAVCGLDMKDFADPETAPGPEDFNFDYCDMPSCIWQWSTNNTGSLVHENITISDATPAFVWDAAMYEMYYRMIDTYNPNRMADFETAPTDLSAEKAAMEERCIKACETNYDKLVAELKRLYATNAIDPVSGEAIYKDENGNVLTADDLCCTAQALIEDCANLCQFDILQKECFGTPYDASVGTKEQLMFYGAILNGSFELQLPHSNFDVASNGANSVDQFELASQSQAMISILNDLFAENFSNATGNATALNTYYPLDHYQGYFETDWFKDKDYHFIKLNADGSLGFSNDGLNDLGTENFFLDQFMVDPAVVSLENSWIEEIAYLEQQYVDGVDLALIGVSADGVETATLSMNLITDQLVDARLKEQGRVSPEFRLVDVGPKGDLPCVETERCVKDHPGRLRMPLEESDTYRYPQLMANGHGDLFYIGNHYGVYEYQPNDNGSHDQIRFYSQRPNYLGSTLYGNTVYAMTNSDEVYGYTEAGIWSWEIGTSGTERHLYGFEEANGAEHVMYWKESGETISYYDGLFDGTSGSMGLDEAGNLYFIGALSYGTAAGFMKIEPDGAVSYIHIPSSGTETTKIPVDFLIKGNQAVFVMESVVGGYSLGLSPLDGNSLGVSHIPFLVQGDFQAQTSYVDGPVENATFVEINDIALLPNGDIAIADKNTVRILSDDFSEISTLTGTIPESRKLNGYLSDAEFEEINSITADGDGNIYVYESGGLVRVISAEGCKDIPEERCVENYGPSNTFTHDNSPMLIADNAGVVFNTWGSYNGILAPWEEQMNMVFSFAAYNAYYENIDVQLVDDDVYILIKNPISHKVGFYKKDMTTVSQPVLLFDQIDNGGTIEQMIDYDLWDNQFWVTGNSVYITYGTGEKKGIAQVNMSGVVQDIIIPADDNTGEDYLVKDFMVMDGALLVHRKKEDNSSQFVLFDPIITQTNYSAFDTHAIIGFDQYGDVVDGGLNYVSLSDVRDITKLNESEVVIADNNRVRILNVLRGTVSTLSGSDIESSVNGPISDASFIGITAVTTDPQGNIYVAEKRENGTNDVVDNLRIIHADPCREEKEFMINKANYTSFG